MRAARKTMRATFRTVAKNWGRALTFKKRGLYDAISSTADFLGLVSGGGYQVLDPDRKMITGLARRLRQFSANELSNLSLPQLRALCRQLERDNSTARSAVEGFVAQTIGTGIALRPDTGDEQLDTDLGLDFMEWCETCDITGKRTMYDLQTVAGRDWFCAGEHIWRIIIDPELIKEGRLPVAILPLESEWIATGMTQRTNGALTHANGLTVDHYGRVQFYHLINPEWVADRQPDAVPANQIIHGFESRRGVQHRGEPWLTPVIERIHQEGDLIDTELKSAINAAAMAVVVTSDYHPDPDDGTDDNQRTDGTAADPALEIGAGAVARMDPGDDVKAFSHDRPSQQIAPFVQMLRGAIAGAVRVSVRWIDRNYGRASFSALRADEQDSARLLANPKELLGRTTIGAAYLAVLPYLCLRRGIPVPVRKQYRLLPDGQPYVNPKDDIEAAQLAIDYGFSTHEAEVAKRGGDYRKTWQQLAKERKEAKEMGLTFGQSKSQAPAATPTDDKDKADDDQFDDDDSDDNATLKKPKKNHNPSTGKK